jgi:signal transduction histidine kinase
MRAPQDHDAALLQAGGLPAVVIRNKEKILDQFCQRVRQSLEGARVQPHPMLIDTLPAFVTRVALALSHDTHGDIAAEYSNIPLQHGNERARFTSYSLAEVLREYQYLREILSDILRAEAKPAPEDWKTMHHCLDEAMTDAATSFVAVQYGVRDMFTAALTHDFRGPLAGALNHLQILRRETDPDERERRITRVAQNLNRLAVMISNLLDASRLNAGERMPLAPESFDAVVMLQEIVADLDSRDRRRVALDTPAHIRVFWDPEKIRRSIYNLLDNALKYSYGEGKISIRAVQTHGRVHISVHNYGDPILPEDQQTLFQPFRRTAEAQLSGKTGWGLGLVQVQAIAEAHGGVVNVESGREAGTTFTLDLVEDVRELRQS